VYDYVRSYLGEGKGPTDFAKQFLEKRSQSRNKAKVQQPEVSHRTDYFLCPCILIWDLCDSDKVTSYCCAVHWGQGVVLLRSS